MARVERAFLVAAFVLAVLLLLWRTTRGVGTWGDEPYQLSTALRYVLGDRPLVDSWDTNFSSAILAVPFVQAHLSVVGSTDGILLAYRGVFLMLSIATSLTAWFALHGLVGRRYAAGIAVLVLLCLPFLAPIVAYGADWLLHMSAAFAALRLYVHPPRHPAAHAIPGVLCALAIIGNPPTVTVVPFFVAALWIAHQYPTAASARRVVAWYLGAGLAVGSVFFVVLRVLSGPGMLSMLVQVVSPNDHDYGAEAQLTRLRSALRLLVLPAVIGASVGVLRRFGKNRWTDLGPPIALLLTLCIGLVAIANGRLSVVVAPQALVFVAAATLWVADFVAGRGRLSSEQTLLVLPAVGSGLGWFIGSNAGIWSAMSAAPLLLAASMMSPSVPRGDDAPSRAVRLAEIAMLASFLVLIGVVAGIGLRYTPEGVTTSMTARVQSGPFKGIYGTPQEALMQAEMVRAIKGLPPCGRIVFLERFPLGYLIAGSPPGTYSTWATYAGDQRLQEYVTLTGNSPNRVVLTTYAGDPRDDGDFPAMVELSGFPGEYMLVSEDENFRVFDIVRP